MIAMVSAASRPKSGNSPVQLTCFLAAPDLLYHAFEEKLTKFLIVSFFATAAYRQIFQQQHICLYGCVF